MASETVKLTDEQFEQLTEIRDALTALTGLLFEANTGGEYARVMPLLSCPVYRLDDLIGAIEKNGD